ncbi:MAG: hypothetical protein ACYTAF_06450 [Planctomycetota bacterium]|jgi:predicted membrane-bound spermidine synthase
MEPEADREKRRAGKLILAGVLLLSASGLLFEIALTRVFSATIWYHFTFVAISVALFGWGMGGFVLELAGARNRDRALRLGLLGGSALFGLSLPAFLAVFLATPATPDSIGVYFALALVPFLLAGIGLSAAFATYTRDTSRLYFADLLGASLGTLAVPVLLGALGAETTLLAVGVLPMAACFLFLQAARASGTARVACGCALAALVALTALNGIFGFLSIRNAPTKALYKVLAEDEDHRIDYDRWNAYSRISAVTGFDDSRYARLFIDSDAWTDVSKWDGRIESLLSQRSTFRYLPFTFHDRPRVLVIGPGGGPDVRLALAAGSREIVAVEMNPLITEYVRRCGARARNLYDQPTVKLVLQEGRNFVRRSGEKYDVILLGFVDSWAATVSGGLSLTENYLYTSEAFSEYYDHLTDTGMLVIVRWPMDVPRCVANSVRVLGRKGLGPEEAGKRIFAVAERKPEGEEPIQTIFMLRKTPFPAGLSERTLAPFGDAHAFHIPSGDSMSPYRELLSGEIDLEEYDRRFSCKADPVTDDRPFYFARSRPHGVPPFMIKLLFWPLAIVSAAALLMIAWSAFGKSGRRTLPGSMVYFSMLGAGFILVEIALIQKLILLLGHPVHALCVLLFFMLLWCSLGSLLSRRVADAKIRKILLRVLPAIVALLCVALAAVPWLVDSLLQFGIAARIAAAALMLAPAGLLMGMPFPLGLRRAENAGGSIPMMWGINGVLSVAGSILAMVIAVVYGFACVVAAGALCYLVAIVPVACGSSAGHAGPDDSSS